MATATGKERPDEDPGAVEDKEHDDGHGEDEG